MPDLFNFLKDLSPDQLGNLAYIFSKVGTSLSDWIGWPVGHLLVFFGLFTVLFFAAAAYLPSAWLYPLVKGTISQYRRRSRIIQIYVLATAVILVIGTVQVLKIRKHVNEADVVVGSFIDNSKGYNCSTTAGLLSKEAKSKLAKFKVFHLEQPQYDFKDSMVSNLLSEKSNVKVVVGGNCESQNDEVAASVNFHVMGGPQFPLDPRLAGKPMFFKGPQAEGFKIYTSVSNLIYPVLLALEAATIECQQSCDQAVKNYLRIFDLLPGDAGFEEVSRFVAGKAANIFFHLKNFAGAEEVLDRQLARFPQDRESLQAKGDLFVLTGRYPEAVAIYQKYAEQHPQYLLSLAGNYAGALAMAGELGKLDDLVARLRSRGDESQISGDVWNALGITQLKRGRPEDAIAYFRKALQSPGVSTLAARQNLAEALMQAGRSDEALPLINSLIEEDPGAKVQYLGMRGLAYMNLKNFHSAVPDLEAAEKGSQKEKFLIHKARALGMTAREEEFKVTIDQIEDRENYLFHFVLAEYYSRRGDCKNALTHFKKSFALGKTLDVVQGIAQCYEKEGDYEKRRKFLENLLKTKDTPAEIKEKIEQLLRGSQVA